MTTNQLLEFRSVTKRYGAKEALGEVSLKIQPGKIIGLLGPNGSGKTTMIKLINGLLQPTAGQVLIYGQRPGIESKRKISYLPERSYLNDWMRVKDILK